MPSKIKNTKITSKNKTAKPVKPSNLLDDQIDTKVKISGVEAKINNVSLQISEKSNNNNNNFSDTPKKLEKEKIINSDLPDTTKPSLGLSRMENIKKNIENDQSNIIKKNLLNNSDDKKVISKNEDYNPEILSAASEDIINIPNKSNLWSGILLVIIIILLTIIGVWYYQQYGHKTNQVKSETASRETNNSVSNSVIDVDNQDQLTQANNEINSEPNIGNQIKELDADINDLGQQGYDNPPALDFGITP